MNKTVKIIGILAAAVCAASSCYDDYVGDYSTVACGFANQTDVRSLIVGEGMRFSTGVALGGTISNSEDRYVSFETDYSLVNSATYSALATHTFSYITDIMKNVPSIEAMPADMYSFETLSGRPGQALIAKGTHLGTIGIQIDSARFLADEGNLYPKLVIPITLTDGHGTDLISGRESTVIGVHYENMLFGNWYHGGYAEVTDASGAAVRTEVYATTIPQAESRVWTLTTAAPFSLTANGVGGGNTGSAAQMKLTLNSDDSITIEPVPGASCTVEADGESRFVRSRLLQDRKIVLNYKYTSGEEVYHAHDTLSFRNRIRDGVNEWQDENTSHYE